jgi:hypothetical protein
VHEKSDFGEDVPRVTMAQRVARSLTLLWALVGMAGIVLAAGGIVLGSIMTGALRKQALDDSKTSLALYTSGVLSPRLVNGNQLRVGEDVTGLVQRSLAARPDILSVEGLAERRRPRVGLARARADRQALPAQR